MKLLKKSSHADMMPRVEIKFNINVQFIVHKLVFGFVLILWLIVSAWPSSPDEKRVGIFPPLMRG